MGERELRRLLDAATPGPWHEWHGDDHHCMNATAITSERCDHDYTNDEGHESHVVALTLLQAPRLASIGHGSYPDTSDWRWDENAALIVALRNAAPALLDVVDAARAFIGDDDYTWDRERLGDPGPALVAALRLLDGEAE